MAITLDGTTGVTASAFVGDGSSLTAVPVFVPTTTSGATQALDVGSFNFFDAGTLTADTTVSFSNVPTEARWTYTADFGTSEAYTILGSRDLVENRVNIFNTASDGNPYGVDFKTDGTKMYVIGANGDKVYQYSLSTAWDIKTATYDSVSFSVATEDTLPSEVRFSSDGTKMFVLGGVNDRVYQYTLSTAWDLSTASYSSSSFLVSAQTTLAESMVFKPDGTKLYIFNNNTNKEVFQYSLSTAWTISTASYDGVSYDVETSVTYASIGGGIAFSPDGTKMITNEYDGVLYEYALSTAWDLSTASYVGNSDPQSLSSPTTSSIHGLTFNNDGSSLFVVSDSINSVTEVTSSVPYTLTLPASVQNPPTETVVSNSQTSYTFYTLDGGTTVNLINEEVL